MTDSTRLAQNDQSNTLSLDDEFSGTLDDLYGIHDHHHGDDCGCSAPRTIMYTEPKIGRNDPCHCGSGRKFKKCCLNLN